MAPLKLVLVLASAPGQPEGDPATRLELAIALDAAGRPDPVAWRSDPEPWHARLLRPDLPPRSGDVQYDPDNGWSITFFGMAAQRPDMPGAALAIPAPLRPGEYVTLTDIDGSELVFRVVGVAGMDEAGPS